MKFLNRDRRLEYEFLPEAIEIIETPPSPLGRIVLWSIALFLLIACAWSYFAKIDITATARGKIVPIGNVKTIQPATSGVIKSIKVAEGQKVKKGQTLITLDTTLTDADKNALEKTLKSTTLERDVMRELARGGSIDNVLASSSADKSTKEDMRSLVESKRRSMTIQENDANDTIAHYQKALSSQNAQLSDAKSILSGAIQQQESTQKEYDSSTGIDKILAESRLNNAKTAVSSARSNIKTIEGQIADTQRSLNSARNGRDRLDADASSSAYSNVVELDKKISEIKQSLSKTNKGLKSQTIKSPIDGIVLFIATTTVGSSTNPAQPLISIVPQDTKLIVEASLQNSDVGFVSKGQEVKVKLDSFPFQRYGYMEGEVSYLSSSSFDNENGSTYKIKVNLNNFTKTNQGREVTITPGMSVSAEIKTGERRVIEFLLDPLVKNTRESLEVR